MITTDGGNGLRNALEVVYPRIPRQHCWAHKTRNVLDKVKKADQEKVKKDLQRISHAKNRQAATQAYWSFCQKYRKAYPGAVKSLESEIDDLLSFYQVKLSSKERQGLDGQGASKSPDGLVAQDPHHQSYRKSISGSKEKDQTHGCLC